MKLRNFATAAAALSLVAAPVAAQERASAPATETSEIAGGVGGIALLAGVLAAVVLAYVLIDDDEDAPASA